MRRITKKDLRSPGNHPGWNPHHVIAIAIGVIIIVLVMLLTPFTFYNPGPLYEKLVDGYNGYNINTDVKTNDKEFDQFYEEVKEYNDSSNSR